MRFVPFVEKNDWEGETWTFWLQLDGNEDELVRLYELVSDNETYELDLNDVESEESVDRAVRRAHVGYHYSDNKVTGRFLCPEKSNKENQTLSEFLDDAFYKGGIADHFRE
jgi:hypothetical protein